LIDTYQARRPCLIGSTRREPGEAVPEAHLWRLVDGMVHGGRLIKVQMSEADFAAAVAKHCPESASAIYDKLGLQPLTLPNEKSRKRPGKRTIVTTVPTEIVDTESV
jgi:hypothetical protein